LLSSKDYRRIEELIEDLEDTIDLLKAEREAVSFTPYEKFRKNRIKIRGESTYKE